MIKQQICQRVAALRDYMRAHGLQAFIVPHRDAHGSEYVPDHWASCAWISGFNGSAGTAVVTLADAALWTDSRYFIAAAGQLEGTPFRLMKERMEGTPSVAEWLLSQIERGSTVGVDGFVYAASEAAALKEQLRSKNIVLNTSFDPFIEIWPDRPALPAYEVTLQPLQYSGESVASKIERLRRRLAEEGADSMLVSALDEVAWLLNMRGTDVHCNPVFVTYVLVKPNEVLLFIDNKKLTSKVVEHLNRQGIILYPYEDILCKLKALEGCRLLLPEGTNAALAGAVRCKKVDVRSPIADMKAIKNAAEIEGFRRAMLRDGVALVKFLRWLKPAVARGGVTEIGVDRRLTALRAAQPLFRGVSFNTIAGYKAHGAVVHYEATPETDVELRPEGMLLIDSGAQYADGTTDITRTIALGEPTAEERRIYTLVLKGHIALSRLKFPEGACGTQLDLAARYAIWQEGYNFGHGTGHGVGSYLSVHEGPHQIRMNWIPVPIRAGMTVTDEPGLYLTDRFGVRIENVLLVVHRQETEFGRFLTFEPLTLCPIDVSPIEIDRLTEIEVEWLNDYHKTVREKLLPLLDGEADRSWLADATRPISK